MKGRKITCQIVEKEIRKSRRNGNTKINIKMNEINDKKARYRSTNLIHLFSQILEFLLFNITEDSYFMQHAFVNIILHS